MLLWYSRPMSSGPCRKDLAKRNSSISSFSANLERRLRLRFSRSFLNTSRPLEKDATIDRTQLETFVCAMVSADWEAHGKVV